MLVVSATEYILRAAAAGQSQRVYTYRKLRRILLYKHRPRLPGRSLKAAGVISNGPHSRPTPFASRLFINTRNDLKLQTKYFTRRALDQVPLRALYSGVHSVARRTLSDVWFLRTALDDRYPHRPIDLKRVLNTKKCRMIKFLGFFSAWSFRLAMFLMRA